MKEVADYIIKTVQEDSIEGFQLMVDYSDIEEEFGIKLTDEIIKEIEIELYLRQEVADVICDGETFDVVIYTDFAPNYISEEVE